MSTIKTSKPKAVKSTLDQVVTCVMCGGTPKRSEVYDTEIGPCCLRHPGIAEAKRDRK